MKRQQILYQNIKSNTYVGYMTRNRSLQLLSILACILYVSAVNIEKGWLTLDVSTGDQSDTYKVEINGKLKEPLALTQSSRIKITGKLTFSVDGFSPEFIAFRLRHPQYENLSEPVLAEWNERENTLTSLIDLGDPKQIKHMSGDYNLEVIISDDRLDSQTRKFIAACKVTFRHSLEQPQPSELKYVEPSIIMTEAPATRIDPPAIFTAFVVILLCVLFAIFLWGLSHQKLNLNLFPSDGTGLLLNVLFLGALGLVMFTLMKFWINWTFIETIQFLTLTILPVSLAANYAFVHIRKG